MAEEVLERVVRAAVGGAIDAVLRFHYESHRSSDGDFVPSPLDVPIGPTPPEEIAFPSVTAAEEEIFGETPPPLVGIDRAVSDYSTMRQRQAQDAAPDVQGGPGEKDVAEWLRLPNA